MPPYCPSHTLMVVKAGNGTGTVISSPAGINCGATCSANYEEGTKVTLTATAASGSTFTGWTGGGGCSGTGKCVVTIKVHTTVTAHFNPNPSPPSPPSCHPHVSVYVKAKGNGSAKIIVKVPGPGKIKIAGSSIRTVYVTAPHKGKFTATVHPKGKVKQHLEGRGWTRRKQIFVTYSSSRSCRAKAKAKVKVKRVVRFRDRRHSHRK